MLVLRVVWMAYQDPRGAVWSTTEMQSCGQLVMSRDHVGWFFPYI